MAAPAEQEWRQLVIDAGLDPAEITVTVEKGRWLRREKPVRAAHAAGLSCEADYNGSTRENAIAAIAGVVDLLTGGASDA